MNSNILMSAILALLESILMYRLYNGLLTFRFDSKYRGFILLAAYSVYPVRLLINSLELTGIAAILTQPIGLFFLIGISLLLFKDSIKKKLLVAFLFLGVIVISDIIIVVILMLTIRMPLSEFVNNSMSYFLGMVIIKLISLMIVEQIITRTQKYRNISFSYSRELSFILSVNVMLSVIVLLLLTQADILQNNLELILFLFLGSLGIISIFSCYLILQIARKSRKELEAQLRIQQMEMEMKLNNDMTVMVNKLRSLNHDMNNHIGIMLGLVETKQYLELHSYLSGMHDDISLSNDFVFIQDKALMVLLNNKFSIATSLGIHLEHDIQLQSIPLPDKDMCTLLGNILDNAIEATSQLKEGRYLKLDLKKKGSQYLISCQNTFAVSPNKVNGRFITTKKDSFIHGIGLKNIESIVNSYDGILDISYDDVFRITVVLTLNEEESQFSSIAI